MELTIGADPELFVKKSGHFVSGHTFPCGSKGRPREVKYGAVQCDGVALEFNIKPAKTKREFLNGIHGCRHNLQEIVNQSSAGKAILVAEPVAPFSKSFLSKLPPEVRALGCNPDFCAYTGSANPRPDAKVTFRTGAGHIHIGWTKDADPSDDDHFNDCCELAKQLDYFLGLPSLEYDDNTQRRELYGKAGAFRPKTYGMEYRTLSNKWLSSNKLIECVFDSAWLGADMFFRGERLVDKFGDFARQAIDSNNRDWIKDQPELGVLSYA